jgi:hypothetical protein
VRTPRPVRTVKQPSKNTDSGFFIQVAAAASMPSQLVYQLLDSYADAGDSAVRAIKRRPNYGVDFLALSDRHDAQVYKPTGTRMEKNCSGAIGIKVIGASDGGPVAYRAAIKKDGVNLG